MKSSTQDELGAFLEVAPRFRLGDLVTEQPHPKTQDLSQLARADLKGAIAVLKEVDVDALRTLEDYAPKLEELGTSISGTLEAGGRIFLCGCGATGRLSISLEIFGRDGLLGESLGESVIGFMAGGDAALVRSIESFEDYPEYGARQLRELGFRDGDLLISTTEGGETPFVIGATEEAEKISSNRPFFLYCNPDDVLSQVAPRSRRVIENPIIRKINLTVGPMAITGSTRMQASTVLMAAVGWAMACRDSPGGVAERARAFREWVERVDFGFLADFVAREARAYQGGKYVLYKPGEFGITVLTDTTERSPTFSLTPFENVNKEAESMSLCYLHVPGAGTAEKAWGRVLGRKARTLEWEDLDHLTGMKTLLGFDFSDAMVRRRAEAGENLCFEVSNREESIRLQFEDQAHEVEANGRDLFSRHLLLKLLLNVHSTLVMGRLGRYEENMMTFVSPTNNKLIDRAIRYVRLLLKHHHGLEPSYAEVAEQLFREREDLEADEPIVLKTVAAVGKSAAGS